MGQTVLDKDPAEYDRLIASLDDTGNEIVWYSPERFNYSVAADLMGDPVGFVRRSGANARVLAGQLFGRPVFPIVLGTFVVLGWISRAWSRRRARHELFLLTAAAAPLLAFLPFHIEIRFFAPLMVVLLIWTAHGLLRAGWWLARSWQTIAPRSTQRPGGKAVRNVLLALPAAAVLAFFALTIPGVVSSGRASLDDTHKQAGLWLKENAPPDSTIMTRDLAVALYAAQPWIPSPNAELGPALEYGAAHDARYYVVDDYEINSLRPQLQALLNEQNPPAGLTTAKTFSDGKRRTIIYEISDGGTTGTAP